MPGTDIIDIEGVDIRSAPIFARDCSMPIVNWIQECPPDEVFANMMINIGSWEDDTTAPAFTDYTRTIQLVDDDCEVPTLQTSYTECELIAPNMAEISLGTPRTNWKELRTNFCRQRPILPNQFCPFDQNGNFAPGTQYDMNFYTFMLSELKTAIAELVVDAAMKGDNANVNEFDGLYNQLENGWQSSAGNACDDRYNIAQVIDWAALTGDPHGTGFAGPDDVTIAGQTVTWWGNVYNVPEGINLAQLFEDMWIDAVNINWANSKGGVDVWEAHIPWGQAKCLLNTAACMHACQTCGSEDSAIRVDNEVAFERIQRLMDLTVMELRPSGVQIPLMQSQNVDPNTMWLGPGSIGGRPSYVLFFDQISRHLGLFDTDMNGGFGVNEFPTDALTQMTRDSLATHGGFETETLYHYVHQPTVKCVKAAMIMCAGLLVCNRHLWLKIENLDCCNAIEPCDDHKTVLPAP